jgi:hypothetical protein
MARAGQSRALGRLRFEPSRPVGPQSRSHRLVPSSLRLFGAGTWKAWKRESLLRYKCHGYLQTAPNVVSYIVSYAVVVIVSNVLYITFNIAWRLGSDLQKQNEFKMFLKLN